MANLGYSFTPGLGNRFRAALNGRPLLPQNQTQALQVLSLRLPDTLGGHPVAPDALLRGGQGLRPDPALRAQNSGTPAAASPTTAPSSTRASQHSSPVSSSPLGVLNLAPNAMTPSSDANSRSSPSIPAAQPSASDTTPSISFGLGPGQTPKPSETAPSSPTAETTAAPTLDPGPDRRPDSGIADFLTMLFGPRNPFATSSSYDPGFSSGPTYSSSTPSFKVQNNQNDSDFSRMFDSIFGGGSDQFSQPDNRTFDNA